MALQDGLEHLILPAITLAAYPLGLIARMTRASMLESLDQDYALTARAYGLGRRTIVWRLALKNALSAPLTVVGLSVAYMLTGTFFVEVVFNWPGIGQYATQAMLAVDYPVIMAVTLLGAPATSSRTSSSTSCRPGSTPGPGADHGPCDPPNHPVDVLAPPSSRRSRSTNPRR